MPKGDGCIEEFERRSVALADALDGLPTDFPIWNWFGIDPPIPGFYHRRMAQEVAVHRWDAQAAAGATTPIDAALAADGIDEVLAGSSPSTPRTRTWAARCTCTPPTWKASG